ncbi:MAG: response regulator receiver protein [Sulfurimonas sp. RIFCSPHIGHO2_12_FULL_36_9]|uniref:chemotaxis protein n=1 Tax=unclassified Sulfurimonas TaxID=2623549 RepID=UPI0008C29BAA|nr:MULTISPECIES: chemotaxis protein [unclassified Sulfurimonas]OHD98183.1 MAG: response regulator receiver protein [Sulfurimonas sp. RIFCSPHIGHO2_12_FULL_36_9]OHD99946.1 MAG: response regulator receiver protein [Sulfurimonas sp. RIFCSPLOWO2_02_FULL_36_28]OHE00343.1 MAG: response regulator receiver protein [Sulfurimonas sp. RIFCSPLOWO2_12_36_12]OHE02683.1 MAG: response regulator receiver protein [Sulfurimonas sp. RIFCSPLOWO2_12_FULL_36_74]
MSVLDNVDAATNLAKNNELQLLVFRVSDKSDSAYYAINVFKTREVVESKNHFITQIPSSHAMLEGTIVLRGLQIPILNLPLWLGVTLTKDEVKKSNILVCDFNGIIIGLRIMSAFRVIKKNWNEMHAPDSYRIGEDNVVINDTRLEDGSLCLVLDYEKLLADVIPHAMVDVLESPTNLKDLAIPSKLKNGTVLIAEDSKTAQKHLKQIFENANLSMKLFDNGKLLIDYINTLGENVSKIPAIITDIEMPEMSGFTVVKILKSNPNTNKIPVIVNSSMTGQNNKREAEVLGADGFIDKTKSQNIIPLIVSIMNKSN